MNVGGSTAVVRSLEPAHEGAGRSDATLWQPDGLTDHIPRHQRSVPGLRCARVGGSVELAGADPGGERGPLRAGEDQSRSGRVLAVPHGAAPTVQIRDLDAARFGVAAAALAPGGAAQISAHCPDMEGGLSSGHGEAVSTTVAVDTASVDRMVRW